MTFTFNKIVELGQGNANFNCRFNLAPKACLLHESWGWNYFYKEIHPFGEMKQSVRRLSKRGSAKFIHLVFFAVCYLISCISYLERPLLLLFLFLEYGNCYCWGWFFFFEENWKRVWFNFFFFFGLRFFFSLISLLERKKKC